MSEETRIAKLEKEIEVLKAVIAGIEQQLDSHNEVIAALVGMPEEEISLGPDRREDNEKH